LKLWLEQSKRKTLQRSHFIHLSRTKDLN
jgi:hypothetical protein